MALQTCQCNRSPWHAGDSDSSDSLTELTGRSRLPVPDSKRREEHREEQQVRRGCPAARRPWRRGCAACHVVANDQTKGTDNVPTFAAIAKIPGFDAQKIARFLRDPHPKMPDMQLSNSESADLAAYIVSLGK